CDLNLLARQQLFRHDLFLEVAILQIDLPSLRQRREDIPVLTNHYLDQLSRKYGIQKPKVHPDAMHRLEGYSWPGNLSELRTVLDRALLMKPREIQLSHLRFDESDWLPLNSRDQDTIHTAVGILERAGFRIGSSAPERLISFMLMKERLLFKTSELAETLGVVNSTARGYLSQLNKLGFVEKHGDRKSAKWSVNLARLNGEEE
ncbi:MAG TPA: hypothetical protein ENH10_00515, partial [Bacteroidetes bacterium]|nr:hypothetical protein [Bacteroidota bacterium]HEX03627.1 hypothetical protein [Bacteroidota bacterium]